MSLNYISQVQSQIRNYRDNPDQSQKESLLKQLKVTI